LSDRVAETEVPRIQYRTQRRSSVGCLVVMRAGVLQVDPTATRAIDLPLLSDQSLRGH
jgi:hypothetical protein